jgi:hypothetical protein
MEGKDKYENEIAFISYLDEKDRNIEMFVEIINWDASFVKFRTKNGNDVMIPTCRVLKVKYKLDEDDRRKEHNNP